MNDFPYREVSIGVTTTASRPSLFDASFKSWHEPRFEPEKRNKDGLRYVGHRFPIKGGISQAEVLARNISEINPLFAKLTGRK